MKLSSHCFDNLKISGFEGEYIFEKIKSTNSFYESHLLLKWSEYISPDAVVYDIGANLGNHALYFSKKTRAKSIYAFEPADINFSLLEKNCMDNDCDNVQIFNVAIGSKEDKANMNISLDNLGQSYVTLESTGDTVVKTLDSFNDIEQPTFIKIDVEGYELEVLKGMNNILKHSHPTLWIEVTSETVKSVYAYLSQFNYQIQDYYDFNFLFVYDVKTGITTDEAIFRHLKLIDLMWIKNKKYSEDQLYYKEKTLKLITEIKAVKQKRIELLENLHEKKLQNERNVNRIRQLISDLEHIKQSKNELLVIINEKKNENEILLNKYRKLIETYEKDNQKF
ncbi:hypothetical protein YSY43_43570 [Paenibacillus sp. YSY-4.3]